MLFSKLPSSPHIRMLSFLGVAIFGAILFLIPQAHALANFPEVWIQAADGGGSPPPAAENCNSQQGILGPISDDPNHDDLDCAGVKLNSPTTYNEDFQICAYFGDAQSCTPWASEGGGYGPQVIGGNSLVRLEIRTNHRPIPPPLAGTTFSNLRVGVQLFHRSNGSGCGDSSGMVWSQGAFSGWAYGGYHDDDPGCGRIAMQLTTTSPYDAHYRNSSLEGTTVAAGAQVPAYNVVMENTAHFWPSDTLESPTTNPCEEGEWYPQEGIPDCEYDEVRTSTTIFLKNLDDGTLHPYHRTIHVTYHAVLEHTQYAICPPEPPGGGGGPQGMFYKPVNWLAQLWHAIVPAAFARNRCQIFDDYEWVAQITRDRSVNVIAGEQVSFDLPSFTAPTSAGTYVFHFRMVKTDGAANGTDPNGEFGQTGNVSFNVLPEPPVGSYTLTLTPNPVTINQGDTQIFWVSSTCNQGFTGPITGLTASSGFGATIDLGLRNTSIPCNTTLQQRVRLDVTNTIHASPLNSPQTLQVNGDIPPNVTATAATASLTINAVDGPHVQLSASPNPVDSGHPTTLTWVVTGNADTCVASGGWSGNKDHTNNVTYTESSSNLFSPTDFYLTCNNAFGQDIGHVLVGIIPPVPPDVHVDLKCAGSDNLVIDGPCDIDSGSSARLSWGSDFADHCTMDQGFGEVPLDNPPPGTPTNPLTDPTTRFTITCTGAGNPGTDFVDVRTHTQNQPVSDLQCKGYRDHGFHDGTCTVMYNQPAHLSWTSDHTNNCSLNQGIGPVPLNNADYQTAPLTAPQTIFTLSCTGAPDDSVTVLTTQNPGGNSIDLVCTPGNIEITQGGTGFVNLETADYHGEVNITYGFQPNPQTPPTIGLDPNPQTAPDTTIATIGTHANTSVGTFTIRFTATASGDPNITDYCDVSLTVNSSGGGGGTLSLQPVASNGTCGAIDLQWHNPRSRVDNLTAYRTYHSLSPGNWQRFGNDIPYLTGQQTYTVTDNHPLAPQGQNYYAVTGVYGDGTESGYSVAGNTPIIPLACGAANVSTSDKDVISVQRGSQVIYNSVPGRIRPCSGESEVFVLPNNGLFAVGDVVTFRINVCNSGTVALTGVSVQDTLSNLDSPGTATFAPANCGTGSVPNFTLSSLNPGAICSITFTATVASPGGPAGTLYRFQNFADIRANEIRPPQYPKGYFRVYTWPYQFQVGSGVPIRNETGP